MTASCHSPGRLAAIASGLVCSLAMATASTASAASSCTFDAVGDLLQVDMSASDDQVQLDVDTGQIRVFDTAGSSSVQLTCAGGTPTVTNTDTVFIVDGSDLPGGASLDGNTQMVIAGPTDFAPGEEAEAGHPANIEFFLNPNNGTEDVVFFFGTAGSDNWELGASGMNWNAAADVAVPDSELILSNPTLFDEVSVNTSGGNDFVSARGGLATGATLDGPEALSLLGGGDTDTVVGGDGDDFLGGEDGNDTMQGFAGNDRLRGFTGNDTYGGGAGSDTAMFSSAPVGVTVSVGQAGPQETSEGTDTLIGMENLLGSSKGDVLAGSGASNTIEGASGSDVLDGRGGDDALLGGEVGFDDALDSVTYSQAPAGVSVNLGAGTATGGAGADTLTGVEDLIGSPFADTLIGSAASNSITGLSGSDDVSALAGADRVDIRDGEADVASCGSELDSATADRASVDSVNADCETVDFLPEPDDGAGGGGGGAGEAPDTEIQFVLSGKAKQRVLRRGRVVATASCPLEACTVSLGGAVRPRTEAVDAAVPERLALKLRRKALRKVERAFGNGRKPKLSVRAQVADAAGNAASDTLRVEAKS